MPPRRFNAALVLGALVLAPGAAVAQKKPPPQVGELKKLTVAELMDIDVTSVSKAAEHRDQAAAAVTVVTAEDLRRIGATTFPEALRVVPGIHVARQNSSTWAVSSRGFSNVNSEKLLVLSDTRSIYTPLFSGVLWDVQGYLLQDIDRIEVIRGPGATLWGSNAVNGVINITTKSAKDTLGLFATAGVGNEEQFMAAARYGGSFNPKAHYRVFATYADRDGTFHGNVASPDDWQSGRFGYRSDWDATGRDVVTVQGEVYRAEIGQLAPVVQVLDRPGPTGRLRVDAVGGNFGGRWRRTTSPAGHFELRAYYDRTHRDDPSFEDTLDTIDVDFHERRPFRGHDLTWGATYRLMANRNDGKGIFAVAPASSRDRVISGFAQDHVGLSDSVRLTFGSKLEHNEFSGSELQPSGRIGWDVSSTHFFWGSVSRAVRVPTRLERDLAIDVTTFVNPYVRLLGSPDFDSERLVAYEAGYRWQPLESLAIDTAAFYNDYSRLAAIAMTDLFINPSDGRTVVHLRYRNLNEGFARGIETQANYSPTAWSRLTASYSYVDVALETAGDDLNRETWLDGATPRHQLALRASLDLPSNLQLDTTFRHLSAIRRLPTIMTGQGLPGYGELDVRLAWRVSAALTISLVGQNLLHDHHAEFGAPDSRGEIERGVYSRIAWGF